MPLYDFRCAACGATFEQRVALAAFGQPVPCPACGAATTERLVSVPAAYSPAASASGPVAIPAGGT
jgi:putative FmdB family regulatory protein